MLSYASWFTIPPGKRSHLVQNNCCYRGWLPLTTFAMRVHTHTLGRSVTMTRVARNGTGEAHAPAATCSYACSRGFVSQVCLRATQGSHHIITIMHV
jgi:hypothetical protein